MKVGIAGAGFMGQTHAQCYLQNPETELYALAERNKTSQNKFADKFSISKTYEDVFDMIDDPDVDIIDICLPTPLHAKVAIAALNKGKNVLLEKPIALSIQKAEEIKEAAERISGIFMVAHVLRFWPEYVSIKKAIDENIGKNNVKEISALRCNELPLWSDNSWLLQEEQSGGIIIDMMIHDIDFILWACGNAKRVFCKTINNQANFPVHAMAIIETINGAITYIEGCYLNPPGCGLSSQMRIYGNNSSIEFYSNTGKVNLLESNKKITELPVANIDGYYAEIDYFVNCVKQHKNPETVTAQSSLESLKVCIALKKALKENKWIDIDG